MLYLTNVFLNRLCIHGLAPLLNSSLKDLHISNCELASDEYNYLTTTIASGTLGKFHFRTDTINKEMLNLLTNLLTQTKSLQVVEWDSSSNCSAVLAYIPGLRAALKHSVVKELILPYTCEDSMADIPKELLELNLLKKYRFDN